jgi:hypothetical protein
MIIWGFEVGMVFTIVDGFATSHLATGYDCAGKVLLRRDFIEVCNVTMMDGLLQ